ncbi:unnamed protein product [Symbiodinium sp. CCMP2456]|nr:unnamed protein product [Symbiodinium sp. CCMP2456]
MRARLPAVMDRIGPAGKTLATGLGVGGISKLAVDGHDMWQARIKRQQEAGDCDRVKARVIHSAFHAAKPEVEIPRKHVQAQISRLLDLDDRSPVLIWGNHQSGKSFALFKACRDAGFHEGIVHVKLDSDKETAGERLRQQLGAPGHVEVEEALKQAAKTLGRLPILAFASMALGYDADAREVRLQIGPLSEEECQQEKAGAFCRARPGTPAAVEHKADLLQLTGGNVGKLEALGDKRSVCTLRSLCSLAGACQEQQILGFLGIDAHGGFDGTKAAKEVARRVAEAPFHQCVMSKDFRARFTSKDLAQAVKARDAHCIYVKATTKADERFCAASPSVHALLKRKTRWLGIF